MRGLLPDEECMTLKMLHCVQQGRMPALSPGFFCAILEQSFQKEGRDRPEP